MGKRHLWCPKYSPQRPITISGELPGSLRIFAVWTLPWSMAVFMGPPSNAMRKTRRNREVVIFRRTSLAEAIPSLCLCTSLSAARMQHLPRVPGVYYSPFSVSRHCFEEIRAESKREVTCISQPNQKTRKEKRKKKALTCLSDGAGVDVDAVDVESTQQSTAHPLPRVCTPHFSRRWMD